jgi:hypothetical protein
VQHGCPVPVTQVAVQARQSPDGLGHVSLVAYPSADPQGFLECGSRIVEVVFGPRRTPSEAHQAAGCMNMPDLHAATRAGRMDQPLTGSDRRADHRAARHDLGISSSRSNAS